MVWLCGDCLTVNNPFPPSDEMSSKSGLNTPISNTPNTSRNTNHDESLRKEEGSIKPVNIEKIVGKEELCNKLSTVLSEQQNAESKPNTCQHVCPRLTEGTCPHGV